jgi:hypothetical protein
MASPVQFEVWLDMAAMSSGYFYAHDGLGTSGDAWVLKTYADQKRTPRFVMGSSRRTGFAARLAWFEFEWDEPVADEKDACSKSGDWACELARRAVEQLRREGVASLAVELALGDAWTDPEGDAAKNVAGWLAAKKERESLEACVGSGDAKAGSASEGAARL